MCVWGGVLYVIEDAFPEKSVIGKGTSDQEAVKAGWLVEV